QTPSFRDGAVAPDLRCAIAHRGILGFRVRCSASPRNDGFKEDQPMQYRQLGRSGLKISPICLGTMMFGGPTDEATSVRIVANAREAGINFIDTADAYSSGNSEQVVGRAISNSRQNWVLATKRANAMGDDPNRGGIQKLLRRDSGFALRAPRNDG